MILLIGHLQEIPQFSKYEWLDVYHSIFGNKYEDWVKAYKTLCSWKMRVSKLPVGIECTIPLLHAQIACEDYSLDTSLKTSVLHMALLRFVSVVIKSYEERHLMGKKMHNLAEKIKLPLYLIDLRNQIIHSDNIFGSTETYSIALKICFQWIHTNFWKEEEKKISKIILKNLKKQYPNGAKTIKNTKSSSKKLSSLIKKRVAGITSHCEKTNETENEKKVVQILNLEIATYASAHPEEAINILVSDLFLSPKLITWMNQSEKHNDSKCQCKSHPMSVTFQFLASHIRTIIEIKAINIFIKTLIGDGNDPQKMRERWLKILVNLCIKTEERKIFLSENGLRSWIFQNHFKWKEHIYPLFSLAEGWTISLAYYLIRKNLVKINPENTALLKKLVRKYRYLDRMNAPSKQIKAKASLLQSSEHVAVLEEVVKNSRKVSKSAYQYANELCLQVREKFDKDEESCENLNFGVLPYQVGDPYFYQKLILPEIKETNS